MAWRASALLALMLAGIPACHAWPTARSAPAIITEPTAASRADLERAVSQAFHGAPVLLADDALTRNDLLIVGRAEVRDSRGQPLNGRELGRPQHFRLLRRDAQCVLLHLETGKPYVLAHTRCRALLERHTDSKGRQLAT